MGPSGLSLTRDMKLVPQGVCPSCEEMTGLGVGLSPPGPVSLYFFPHCWFQPRHGSNAKCPDQANGETLWTIF